MVKAGAVTLLRPSPAARMGAGYAPSLRAMTTLVGAYAPACDGRLTTAYFHCKFQTGSAGHRPVFCMVLLQPGDKSRGARPGSVLSICGGCRVADTTPGHPFLSGNGRGKDGNRQSAGRGARMLECQTQGSAAGAIHVSPGRTPFQSGSSATPRPGRESGSAGGGNAQSSRSPLMLRFGRSYKAASRSSSRIGHKAAPAGRLLPPDNKAGER